MRTLVTSGAVFLFLCFSVYVYSPSASLGASLLIRGMLVLVAVLKPSTAMTAFVLQECVVYYPLNESVAKTSNIIL